MYVQRSAALQHLASQSIGTHPAAEHLEARGADRTVCHEQDDKLAATRSPGQQSRCEQYRSRQYPAISTPPRHCTNFAQVRPAGSCVANVPAVAMLKGAGDSERRDQFADRFDASATPGAAWICSDVACQENLEAFAQRLLKFSAEQTL